MGASDRISLFKNLNIKLLQRTCYAFVPLRTVDIERSFRK